MAAREEVEALHRIVREKDVQLQNCPGLADLRREILIKDDLLLQAEAWRRVMEAENAELRQRLSNGDDAENVRLRRELEAVLAGQAAREPSRQEVVRWVATLECLSLKSVGQVKRVAMKKKLLLKWHPDKQIGAESASFSKEIMQEMQNSLDWG